ncbi:unnamed protein product [Ostreobium quekettii]|uniref:Calcium-dependent protein kinase n=1 Tax=Ostreobium quekettii TaxID=121088 RepID=A0A8S1J4S4_9CHLO|nr:unnamed protein product [Ostreobium quekettii]|eukprot:evm.model.scf_104.5 EVM.evm.TU.scf_104.5   scf_104:38708-50247(+)
MAGKDYVFSATDDPILKQPPKTALDPEEIKGVFGYPRDVRERFHFGEVIGTGSYGVVRRCIEKESHKEYAVKTLPKTPKKGPPTPRYLLKLRNEVDVMRQVGNSLNAVHLLGAYEDDHEIHLVMELCTGGPLLDRLLTHKRSEQDIAQIARSILQFIAQCHAKGIVYRDVKTDNFLFQSKADGSPLKATDFGLSIRHWPNEPPMKSRTGTPAYMAPELIMQNYTELADVWSVGMLTYQLLTGRFPYWDDISKCSLKQLWAAIVTKDVDLDRPDLVGSLSEGARSFLKMLLVRNPDDRPSAHEALMHPWVMEGGTATALPLQGSVVQRLQRFATYGDLKQLVLKRISELHLEEGAVGGELRDLFDQLDVDSSGWLSLDELSHGLRAQGYSLSDEEARQLMSEVDVDGNGKLDFDEFMATLVDWNEVQIYRADLDRIFGEMDTDGDGFISLAEIAEYLPSYLPLSSESGDSGDDRMTIAKRMLREADKNEDGFISRDEFNHLMVKSMGPDSLDQYDSRIMKPDTPRQSAAPRQGATKRGG